MVSSLKNKKADSLTTGSCGKGFGTLCTAASGQQPDTTAL